jgi:formylglycine-generating enzyme required for sulfatase activity
VVSGGKILGTTPLTLPEVLPGPQSAEVRLRGYKAATVSGTVAARTELRLNAVLEKLPGPEVGQTWTIPDLNLAMVPISPGTFTMGDGGDAHQVILTQNYWLGKTEVTQREWQSVMGNNPSSFKGDDLPVESVSWDDAMAFCRKLTERERAAGRLPEDYVYTLPTEAQWEYACRSGTKGDYAGNLNAMAWYDQNSGNTTHPVGQKQANAWGLSDMHGNVWEWCADWYGNYPGGSVTDPTGPASGSFRVIRGGSWGYAAEGCRSASRGWDGPVYRNYNLGFRLALSAVR